MRNTTIEQLREYLENNGYLTEPNEFEFAEQGAFKYIGFDSQSNQHKFLVGFEDTTAYFEGGAQYYITMVFVSLGYDGLIVGEYAGVPIFEGTEEQCLKYCDERCN